MLEITFIHEGRDVFEVRKWLDEITKVHMVKHIKIRTCNTAEEAKAVANYYRVRDA